MQEFGERAAAAVSAAFGRRNIGDTGGVAGSARIVIHQPGRTWLAGGIDQQQGAGRAIDGNAFDAAKIDHLPEVPDRNYRRPPPKLRILIDLIALLPRWRQCGRRESLDVTLAING